MWTWAPCACRGHPPADRPGQRPGTGKALTRTWTVDATRPEVAYALSEPLLTVTRPGRPTEYVYNGPFTMGLTGTDDGTGQVTSEFRLDGDGWHNYYGWPTDARSPFLFTATGTDVDGLVYGNLGSGGLSVSPFAERSPGTAGTASSTGASTPSATSGRLARSWPR
ncbi:hypothetical protein NKG94_20715 [Micromonospora sp. M12]